MPNPLHDALLAPLAGRRTDLLILPDGTRITGEAFLRQIAQVAHALRAAGVAPGDRIALQSAKSPTALAVYGAALALGAVLLPLNPAYTAAEVAYFLADASPCAFVCDSARAGELGPVAGDARLFTLNPDGSGSLADAAAGMPHTIVPADRGADDLAALLYTSGTTGRSKGAMLTHRNLLSNAETLARLWRFTDRDVLLHALPIFHTHGLFVATNMALLTGGAMIFLPAFDPAQVLHLLPQATVMMGVPTFYTRLLADPGLDRARTAGLRLFISGSAPLLADTHAAFAARTGHAILERYGMTETSMIASNPLEGDRRAGTVGFPLPGVAVRITEQGAPVPPGEVGMIEVQGPNVFAGYWRMPEKTAADMRAGGYFATGDLGRFDADGYLHIVGREKDMVISGGFNIYPTEVEALLDAVPGVRESAVIGLPHPDLGEAVFAVLTGTADPDAALHAIRPQLARYKQPRAAIAVAELPRNAMGKVQKAALRAEYAQWFVRG